MESKMYDAQGGGHVTHKTVHKKHFFCLPTAIFHDRGLQVGNHIIRKNSEGVTAACSNTMVYISVTTLGYHWTTLCKRPIFFCLNLPQRSPRPTNPTDQSRSSRHRRRVYRSTFVSQLTEGSPSEQHRRRKAHTTSLKLSEKPRTTGSNTRSMAKVPTHSIEYRT